MKKYVFLVSLLLVFVVPQILFSFFYTERQENGAEQESVISHEEKVWTIWVKDGDNRIQMNLDDYVTCVVLGEMPADFGLEALKAQAVATRTYTLQQIISSGKHPDADVCTDASCCQAFVPVHAYTGGEDNFEKVESAVTATSGQVLTYDGELIEATYFSTSGGKTEDAVAVWGSNVPYLHSVDSPGEEQSKHFETVTEFPQKEFLQKLGLPESACLSENSFQITYTNGGGVEQLCLSGETFTGVQLRTLLGLSSTAMTIQVSGDSVRIITKGNGHRVGMSQYGAEAMAVRGCAYDEILLHYYSGAKLETFTYEQMNAVFDKEENL